MAAVLDAATTDISAGTSKSFSHTCSGPNRLLIVAASIDGVGEISTLTYNSVALTRLFRKSDTHGLEVWYLIAPASGSNTLAATMTNTDGIAWVAASFRDAHQSVPLAMERVVEAATGTSASHSIASLMGQLIVDAMLLNNVAVADAAPDSGQTQIAEVNQGGGGGIYTGMSYKSGAVGTTTLGYTWTGSVVNKHAVIAIRPSPVAKTVQWRVHKPAAAITWGSANPGRDVWNDLVEIANWNESPLPVYDYGLDSAGIGEMQVNLPRRIPTYSGGDPVASPDLALGNMVEVHVVDTETSDEGSVIGRWRLREYSVDVDSGAEGITALLLPESTILAETFIEGAITFTATDPANMMKWFLENNYLPGYAWDYDNATAGATYTRTFQRMTMLQIFEDIRKLAGETWHYVLQRDYTVRFRANPATAEHVLAIGRGINQLNFTRSIVRQVTRVILYYTGGSYTATAAEYDPDDPHDLVIIDEKVTTATLAQQVAETLLGLYNIVELRGTCTVIDSNGLEGDRLGYDIESIIPGDTVKIVNPLHVDQPPTWGDATAGTTIWDGDPADMGGEVLLVTKVHYGFDDLAMEFTDRQPSAVLSQEDIVDKMLRHLSEATV